DFPQFQSDISLFFLSNALFYCIHHLFQSGARIHFSRSALGFYQFFYYNGTIDVSNILEGDVIQYDEKKLEVPGIQ
ncbi:hypothetical protein, partial [Enterocloster lavalensis]|uniref:hypothetical protein n=1 Tax=Enterocloster lavalensis TaxID=460384 RepID=UPI002FD8EFBC